MSNYKSNFVYCFVLQMQPDYTPVIPLYRDSLRIYLWYWYFKYFRIHWPINQMEHSGFKVPSNWLVLGWEAQPIFLVPGSIGHLDLDQSYLHPKSIGSGIVLPWFGTVRLWLLTVLPNWENQLKSTVWTVGEPRFHIQKWISFTWNDHETLLALIHSTNILCT
jgi:hypothetical protein